MTTRKPGTVCLGLLMQRWSAPERPFGNLTPFARTVSRLAEEEGVSVLVIDPDDVDLRRGRVKGLRLRPGGGWVPAGGTLPDVVWNRYFRHDREGLLQGLQRKGVMPINEIGLNKWEAYRLLQTDPILQEHLPETCLLRNGEELKEMTDRYPVVYLKPVAGSVGRGIIRATARPTGLTRLEYVSTRTGLPTVAEASPKQLGRWATVRKGSYIVQRGLDLAVFYGRSADIRVLMQKDGDGCWQLTGMGARVAAAGRFTSNLHTGGSGVPLGLLSEAVFPTDPDRREKLGPELKALAFRTAGLVESTLGAMGELGLDFGVDRKGNIWYIEQNAQPGRTLFQLLGREDLSELAHRRPIQYARHLALAKSARAAGHQET
ncbi:MAG TPA: YheC/YheD family protein [Symbiobacteriaceae bacterium]|nr:YheC/YheD family protein [Symbiobacteriaceae bacterium]